MIGEVIAIGDELISGRVLNTTSRFIASKLFASGRTLKKITVIGDNIKDIKDALLSAINTSEFVIVSGGLGPTTDDITNEAVSKSLGIPLVKNTQIEEQIKEVEQNFGKDAREQFKKKLVMLPKGAKVLNPEGHAAGYELDYNGVYLFFLPGVPEQLKDHLIKRVIPRLNQLDKRRPFVFQEIFKIFGLSEIEINISIEKLIPKDSSIKIGYYPVFPEVHVSITVIDSVKDKAKEKFGEVLKKISNEFKENIVAIGEEGSLAKTVGELLKKKGFMLACAESCTGGLLGATVTDIPGSSGWFDSSIVTYSNREKEKILYVSQATLAKYGAVSRNTALEMLKGVRKITGCECILAITGIAGPDGGTDEKPVGTVYIGMSVNDKDFVHRFLFSGSRSEIRQLSVETSLDWLRRYLCYDSLLPGYKPVE